MKKVLSFIGLFTFLIIGTNAQVIVTVAGNGTAGYLDAPIAVSGELNRPEGVFADDSGNIFIIDNFNHRVRKVNTAGSLTTYAFDGTAGYFGEGCPATQAQFSGGYDLVEDRVGNLYVSDLNNQIIRKITPSGIIRTIAGIPGTPGYSGDGGPANMAMLKGPANVTVDDTGNLYIAEWGNHRIRRMDTFGIITTICGTGARGYFSPDGTLASAAKITPSSFAGLKIDKSGNIYFQDSFCIRKINTAGIITTIAGTISASGYSGDGGPATLAKINPQAFGIDTSGNVYIACGSDVVIRKINASGIITTIAGTPGIGGYSGDGGPPLLAKFNGPEGISVNKHGDIYIADAINNRIRMITSRPLSIAAISKEDKLLVTPNPNSGIFSIYLSSPFAEEFTLVIKDMLGNSVKTVKNIVSDKPVQIQLDVPSGIYFIHAYSASRHFSQKIIIE